MVELLLHLTLALEELVHLVVGHLFGYRQLQHDTTAQLYSVAAALLVYQGQLIGTLESLTARLPERPVLICCTDRSVRLVSAHRERLEPSCRIVLPDPVVVETLMDKARFAAWAQPRGYPIPQTIEITDRGRPIARLSGIDIAPLHDRLADEGRISAAPRAARPSARGRRRVTAQGEVSGLVVAERDARR